MTLESVQQLIDTYLVKVTGFAHLRMENQQEAEDLAQDIMLEIIDSWNRGRQVNNFDAYVWTISRNVLNRAIRRKHRITYIELADSYCAEDNALQNCLTQEEHALLRREIGLLSSVYRNAVVRYYYEGKTVREIASIHSVSEGTVKWWLFEARNQLRKGVETMRQNGEKSFNPGHLSIAISGTNGNDHEPFNLVNGNLLAQNILLSAYAKPVNEVGMAQELGVSRPYIESEVQRLVSGELLKEISPGMYQTDFVISNASLHQEAEKVMEQVYPSIRKKIDPYIESIMPILMQPAVNVAGFTPDRILWTAIPMTIAMLHQIMYQKITKTYPPPERPNGGRWMAIGYMHDSAAHEDNPRYDYNGPIGSYFEVGGMILMLHQYSGLNFDPSRRDLSYGDDAFRKPLIISTCIDIAKGQLDKESISEIEKQTVADAISLQLVKAVDNEFKPNFLFIPKHEMEVLKERCSELAKHLEKQLNEMLEEIITIVKKHSPEHVWWQIPAYSHYFKLMPMLLDDYYKEGRLSQPVEEDKHVLSFYIWS